MTSVAVLIPVLERPHRVAPLAESVARSTGDTPAVTVFICNRDDEPEIAAVREAGLEPMVVPWSSGAGDYARKLNHAYREMREEHEWCFLGADDLVFRHGWIEACLRMHGRGGACVIGTNDLGNQRVIRGNHSTHSLVHRDYLECGTVDEDGRILHEGYGHQFVDDEFIQTATLRRTFQPARDAVVEHMHPHWGKADDDATYQKGQASFYDDKALFESRKHLWLAMASQRRRNR